ncbi:uncharacterized protein B0H64DRAFT_242749 [Chaetomium fimeti]|uniref:Secreted protein n=1 Tax=Chaetomium fimeti TaxID=1854472 RepID=A0AAE0H8I1_9PEZI|nr:hypothetical protein B0H64DRAFT_242749 [Chaetomium fimeti]
MPDSASVLFCLLLQPLWSCGRCAGFSGVTSRVKSNHGLRAETPSPPTQSCVSCAAYPPTLPSLRGDETPVLGGLLFACLGFLADVTNDSIPCTPRVVPLAANAANVAAFPRLPNPFSPYLILAWNMPAAVCHLPT